MTLRLNKLMFVLPSQTSGGQIPRASFSQPSKRSTCSNINRRLHRSTRTDCPNSLSISNRAFQTINKALQFIQKNHFAQWRTETPTSARPIKADPPVQTIDLHPLGRPPLSHDLPSPYAQLLTRRYVFSIHAALERRVKL